ncbi:MAG: phage portal protein [Variovorax sp.]
MATRKTAGTVVNDKLVNVVANLGTDRDKAAASFYGLPILTDDQAMNAYRGAWLPRKIVDIPALDATRRWRAWQAKKEQVEKIEAEERRLQLRSKVRDAMIKARLFGGAAIFLGTADRRPERAIVPGNIGRGGLKYLAVMTCKQLQAGELERDVLQPGFGKPKDFTLSSATGVVKIHPSRLILFPGAPLPDPETTMTQHQGWGDSVLTAVMQAVSHSDSTMANVASLVFEAKVDVIRIPEFMAMLESNPNYPKLIHERLMLAAAAKGINGMLLLDKEEEYQTKSAAFTSLPDVIDRFLQAVSGASDIPATRLLGQSPAGLSATGESDARNYYDRIQSMQELDVSPAMEISDECLIRSALGVRPREIHYIWNTLWQPTAAERSAMGKEVAETIKTLKDANLFKPEALSEAAANLLVENSVLPGLEAALETHGRDVPKDPVPTAAGGAAPAPRKTVKKKVTDAAPRTLYVSRKVTNAAELLKWARAQGFKATLAAADLHVTIAFSREPVDWMAVGDNWMGDSKGTLNVSPGGARLMEKFGEATVLLFNSSELAWRHMAIREAGASWDWPEYQPHISITYEAGDVELSKVEPYRGRIVLGPEIFAEVDEDWKAKAIS